LLVEKKLGVCRRSRRQRRVSPEKMMKAIGCSVRVEGGAVVAATASVPRSPEMDMQRWPVAASCREGVAAAVAMKTTAAAATPATTCRV